MAAKRLARPFALKDIGESDGTFSGYGSVFDVVDAYGDVVVKGAFSKSLQGWKAKGKLPAMLWQHDAREPIGVWTKMSEDETGLYVEGKILVDAGEVERRAYAHMKAGSISGLSIGYDLPKGGFAYDSTKGTYTLTEIDLWEVSPVTFPANESAQIDAVKTALVGGPKHIERLLRDAGFSRSQAKGLLARGYEGIADLREAEDGELEVVKRIAQDHIDKMRAAARRS